MLEDPVFAFVVGTLEPLQAVRDNLQAASEEPNPVGTELTKWIAQVDELKREIQAALDR